MARPLRTPNAAVPLLLALVVLLGSVLAIVLFGSGETGDAGDLASRRGFGAGSEDGAGSDGSGGRGGRRADGEAMGLSGAELRPGAMGERRAVEARDELDAGTARFAEPIEWEGHVLDRESEAPIPGVLLVLEGGSYGNRAETDEEGAFTLRWSAGLPAHLTLSHPDYVDLSAPEVDFAEPGRFLLPRSGRIEGRILRYVADEGARAHAWYQAASSRRFWESLEAEIAADGSFAFADLRPGDYAVTALVPERFVGIEMGVVVEHGGVTELVLQAAPGSEVFGRVTRTDTHGSIPGTELVIEPRTEGLPDEVRTSRTAVAVTNRDGTYAITGLAPGIHRLRAKTPWGADQGQEVHIPSSGDRLELDLSFPGPARLSGYVVDAEGKGAAGAQVFVFFHGDRTRVIAWLERGVDPTVPRTTTGPRGTFAFTDLPAGRPLLVVAYPPGTAPPGAETAEIPRGLPGFASVQGIEEGQEQRDIEVSLPASFSLAGTVTDTAGAPLAGAVVHAEYTYQKRTVRAVHTQTDARGRFLLAPLRKGQVVVGARRDGYLSQRLPARIEGEEGPPLDFVLEACLSIIGVALDEHGFAVPHVPVSLRLDPEHTVPPEHASRGTRRGAATDDLGRFRIDGLFDAPWIVRGGSYGWEMVGADPPVLVPSQDDFVTLTFAPRDRPARFAIEGRVGLVDGGVPTGVRVTGLQGGVLEVDGGEFFATGLTPSRHRLRVYADGHVPRSVGPIDPVPGETVDVGLIDLLPATRLTVRLTNAGGKAVDDAAVVLVPLSVADGGMGEEGGRITLEAEGKGRYRHAYVPRFAWRLVVTHKKLGRHAEIVRIKDEAQQTIKVKWK